MQLTIAGSVAPENSSAGDRKMPVRLWLLWMLIGGTILFIGLRVNWKVLPVDEFSLTLNDQVGYISVARHWLDQGTLNSSIIYPSLLRQTTRRNSLYMPGFYAELAFAYRELGYSALTSRVPALVSLVVALGLVMQLHCDCMGLRLQSSRQFYSSLSRST